MGEWSIKNYQPRWTSSIIELSKWLVESSILGSRINSTWSLWDQESNEWFDDAPIVVRTDKHQLEFCANKIDEFSFSLDSIDIDSPVYWCGCEDSEAPLQWVKNRNPEFRKLAGKSICNIHLIESKVGQDMKALLNLNSWILSGLSFDFQDSYLEIFNGLDCNALRRDRYIHDDVRYTEIALLIS